jgi:hypothetical protein
MSAVLEWVGANRARAASLAFLAALVVLLGLLFWRAHKLRLPPAAAVAVPVPSAPVAVLPANPAPGQRTARLRAEFDAAPDYLAFIQGALARPQEGGKFYAMLAWERCDAAHGDEIEKRCTGVKMQYPDLQTLYRVATELRGGRDALLPEGGRGFVAPATRETAQADVDAAIRSGDRYAIAHALNANRSFLDLPGAAAAGSAGAPASAVDIVEPAGTADTSEGAACGPAGCGDAMDAVLRCAAAGTCSREDLARIAAQPGVIPRTATGPERD